MANRIYKLNRYTKLEYLIQILENRQIVLIDPVKKWEDRNDIDIIIAYKKKCKINNLFALCFSFEDETIYHWKNFSYNSDGCCIEFNAEKLIEIVSKIKEIRKRKVVYKKISEVCNAKNNIKKMPFTKRWPYRYEKEYRFIWEEKNNNISTDSDIRTIDINLSIINKITFSHKMCNKIFNVIKEHLIKKYKLKNSIINKSTIIKNEVWINYFN